jgi:capsular exopolysaccharide synthesis family protein
MGRIEEALRRAGGLGEGIEPSSPIPNGQVFASPWGLPEAALPSPAAEVFPVRTETLPPPAPHPDGDFPPVRRFAPRISEGLTASAGSSSALAEQFRRLAGSLHNAQLSTKLKLVMVTSAVPGDGKTVTALNLALILSESYGRRVLLVDADLRRPSLHFISGFGETPGLSEALKSHTDQKLPVCQLTDRLTLLPAGRPNPDPVSGLSSTRMRRVLEEATTLFDWVILDTPPMETADTSLLAAMVDTVLFVVRAARTPLPMVRKAIEALGRDRIFGVVLNAMQETERPPGRYQQERLHNSAEPQPSDCRPGRSLPPPGSSAAARH